MKRPSISQLPVVIGPLVCLAVGLILEFIHESQLLVGAAYVCSVICVTWLVPVNRSRITVAVIGIGMTASTLLLAAWIGMTSSAAAIVRVPIISLIWAAVTAMAMASQAAASRQALRCGLRNSFRNASPQAALRENRLSDTTGPRWRESPRLRLARRPTTRAASSPQSLQS
jgi:hypothetical protein